MLTHIEITNFKGVGEKVRIPIAPITLLFGANSTGKSTILHALHYAYEVLAHQNLDVDVSGLCGNNVNLGGFQNLLHNRDLDKELCLAIGVDLSDIDIPEFSSSDEALNLSSLAENACVRFAVRWNSLDNKPYVPFYEVEINGVPAARLTVEAGRKEVVALYNMKHPIVKKIWDAELIDSFTQWDPIHIANLTTAIPNWGTRLEYVEYEDATYIPDGNLILSQVLVGVGSVLTEFLSKLRYIGPIRSIMPRNYEGVKTTSQQDWSDGSAAWDAMLSGTPGFVHTIGEWLEREDRLNSGYRLRLKQYKEVDLASPIASIIQLKGVFDAPDELSEDFNGLPTKRRLLLVSSVDGTEYAPHDVGVGLSQVIPIVATSLVPSSEFVCVEQPELHIHPAMQTALGDLFASQIINRNCLFLIETHSEHLLLRLLRRVRETFNEEVPPEAPWLTADKLSVVYVETEDGGVKLTPVKVSRDGEFETRWPKGFFDERAAELF